MSDTMLPNQKVPQWLIRFILVLVSAGLVGIAAVVLFSTHQSAAKHPVKHLSIRPTDIDYREFVNNHWRYASEANQIANSMLKSYQSYRNGRISLNDLHHIAKTDTAQMRTLLYKSDGSLPKEYATFGKQVDELVAAEIESVNYFSSSNGILIDALADQLDRLTVEFSGLTKQVPTPATHVQA